MSIAESSNGKRLLGGKRARLSLSRRRFGRTASEHSCVYDHILRFFCGENVAASGRLKLVRSQLHYYGSASVRLALWTYRSASAALMTSSIVVSGLYAATPQLTANWYSRCSLLFHLSSHHRSRLTAISA
jgi:hypothetical protein